MRRLRLSAEGERGAVAILVAILLPLVFIGMAALTVDVGNISAERRQLQNGADAVALSAAMDCARNASCPTVAGVDPEGLGDGNAADGATKIARVDGQPAVCGAGTGTGSDIANCSAVASGLGDCVEPNGPMPGQYVRVYTQTETKSGSTLLPYFFAQALTGGSAGITQQTCATAAWGPPAAFTSTLPFTLSACEWYTATINGTTYPTPEIAIKVNAQNDAPCTFNGHDQPGGFGWLAADATCKTQVDANAWVPVSTGVGGGNTCASQINATVGHVVYVPVYDCQSNIKFFCDNTANGNNANYHILGLAAFYMTAVDINGQIGAALPGYPSAAAKADCQAKGGKCIYGYFLEALAPPGSVIGPPGTPNLGAQVIQMVG